jgi:hypothetical protein
LETNVLGELDQGMGQWRNFLAVALKTPLAIASC